MMVSSVTACWKPRCMAKAIAFAFFTKLAFCLYISLISWHYMMERPAVKQNVTHITIDGYLAGRSSGEGREAMCTVPERLSYKVHSEMPYSDLMSLLDDRRPDGSLNEHFYGGVQFTLWKRLLPFLSWDGERMLKIAIDELVYGNEDSAAFLPLLPWLANIGGKALRFLHLSHAARLGIDASSVEAPKALYMGIAGLVITNIAGIIAAGVLYLLVWEVLYRRKLMADSRDGIPVLTIDELKPMSITYEYIERIAYFSVVFFCLGPATVHCTSIYTENLFCLSTFSGQLLLFAAEDHRKIATHGSGHKTKSYIKSYVYEVAAVALFFLGSALRSNGVLLLVPLFFYTVRTCGIIGRFNVLYGYDMNRLGLRRSAYDGKVTFLSILRFFSHWVRALIYAILLIVPMAVFQGYLYCMYCLKLPSEQFHAIRRYPGFVRLLVKSDGITLLQKVLSAEKRYVRPWCSSIPPRAYDYVQKKYWDVGFLWVLRPPSRLHVFLYCWTTYMVTYYAIRWYGVTVHQLRAKIWRSFAGWSLKPVVTVLSHPEMGMNLHMAITAATFVFFAHAHVYMRQALPLVPYALAFAVLAERLGQVGPLTWKSLRALSPRLRMTLLLLLWNIALCFVGGALFANFIGFT